MIYTEQSILLRLATGIDLSAATDPKITYQKPNGSSGEWTATIEGSDLVYATSNSDLDRRGVWKFQAFVTISGLNRIGQIARATVHQRIG